MKFIYPPPTANGSVTGPAIESALGYIPASDAAAKEPLSSAEISPLGVIWENPTAPIKLTASGGADNSYNLWPLCTGLYDDIRDQIAFGYSSGSSRAESGSIAAYDKVAKIRVIKNVSTIPLHRRASLVESPVTIHSETNVAVLNHSMVMVQSGPNRGRYVAILSRLQYSDDPSSSEVNRAHKHAYSDDGGATWTVADMVDTSASTVTGSWFIGLTALSDGSLIGWNNRSTVYGTSNTYEVWRSRDGGNSWNLQLTLGASELSLYPQYSEISATWFAWEPTMVEVDGPDHLYVLWRAGTIEVGNTRLCWSVLSNKGTRMTPLRQTNIANASNAAQMFYDKDTRTLHAVIGSRGSLSECGTYYANASLEGAMTGQWNTRARINTTANVDNTSRLHYYGYPTCARVGQRVYAFWMDQTTSTSTDIYMGVGTLESHRLAENNPERTAGRHYLDTLNHSSVRPGMIVGYDFRNRMPAEVDDLGNLVTDLRDENPRLLRSIIAGQSPTRQSDGSYRFAATTGDSFYTAPKWRMDATSFGMIVVFRPDASNDALATSAFRGIFALRDDTNNTSRLALQYAESSGATVLRVGFRAGANQAATVIATTRPTAGQKHTVAVWFNGTTRQAELWLNGTSVGTATATAGTSFDAAGNHLIAGASPYGPSTTSLAMDLYFAGMWQEKAGFDAARAYLQTAY